MGLTTWKKAPDGKIIKSDVVIAKNYLSANDKELLEDFGKVTAAIAKTFAESEFKSLFGICLFSQYFLCFFDTYI